MVPYLKFKETAAPVAYALQVVGVNWGSALVSVGAMCGITSSSFSNDVWTNKNILFNVKRWSTSKGVW